MVSVNVVVLTGRVSAEPVPRTLPSGDRVMELRVSVAEPGKRELPLPVSVWSDSKGFALAESLERGSEVLVSGRLVRRFYRSGAGARSLTEVVATSIRLLTPTESLETASEQSGSIALPAAIGLLVAPLVLFGASLVGMVV